MITGIDDAVLLRALAEDVPDMAETVRNQLRHIAEKIESGELVGQMRCRKCGENVDIRISMGALTANVRVHRLP